MIQETIALKSFEGMLAEIPDLMSRQHSEPPADQNGGTASTGRAQGVSRCSFYLQHAFIYH